MFRYLISFIFSLNLAYAGSVSVIEDASYLSYNKENIKLISKGKVYFIDNKVAKLPVESLCHSVLSVPPAAILKVTKATKKQLKLKCIKNSKKNNTSR